MVVQFTLFRLIDQKFFRFFYLLTRHSISLWVMALGMIIGWGGRGLLH